MKTKFFTIAVFLSLIMTYSCTDDSEVVSFDSEELTVNTSSIRSYDDAMKIAQSGINMLENSKGTRSSLSIKREIDMGEGVRPIYSSPLTRSPNEDPLMYVVNFKDNMGYAIVSADKEAEGLIAVTESGHYAESDSIDNPGLALYMDKAKDYLLLTREENSVKGPNRIIRRRVVVRDTLYYDTFGPMVEVNWGQTGCEGMYCPNGIAGCGPIAMAMVMSYFEQPQSISLTYPGADLTVQSLNWSLLNQHKHVGQSSDPCTNDTHQAIGRLCRQLGNLVDAVYTDSSTICSMYNSWSVLNALGYTVGYLQDYMPDFYTELAAGKILLMRGVDPNTNGHEWLIDGYSTYRIRHRIYSYTIDNTGFMSNWILEDEGYVGYVHYYHINWGWYGANNGYFYDGVFNVSQAKVFDGIHFSWDDDYSQDIECFTVYHE